MSNLKSTKTRTITIRNVNDNIYKHFITIIQHMDLNLGEAYSKLMDSFLKNYSSDDKYLDSFENVGIEKELDTLVIDNKSDVVITKKKLIESESKIIFMNCKNIHFDKDISKEVFKKYIHKIQYCKGVTISSSIPELIRLSKSDQTSDIELF